MRIPGSEKAVPAFSHILLATALLLAPGFAGAQEDVEKDYEAGVAAHRVNDMVGAMTPLKRAADAGHAAAQALYGEILDRAELNDEAVEYLRKAADQGNADGQFGLAVMYLTGEGVEQDDKEAARWMRAAATQGHVQANIALAKAYVTGDERLGGQSRSDATAAPFLLKAAEAGELIAMDALAKAYLTGEFGLQVDAARAEEWTARAAKARTERFGPAAGNKR